MPRFSRYPVTAWQSSPTELGQASQRPRECSAEIELPVTANPPHPALALDGGAIADFLPHLASLAHLFVGPHRRAHAVWIKRKESVLPFDEFRGLVDAERGTATVAFSAGSQPDAFWLRVYGERMQ